MRSKPTRHSFHIAANAAQLGQLADEPLKTEALARAQELEQRSVRKGPPLLGADVT